MPTVHLLIKGKVQGVYYRATAREKANALGITGWINNTPVGHVEMIASGNSSQLEVFIGWCKKGPPAARVGAIEHTAVEEAYFETFTILRH